MYCCATIKDTNNQLRRELMKTANIYLNFAGNCRTAFDFYKSIFGGEFSYVGTYGDMPPMEEMPPLSEEMKKQIMHISLPIGGDTTLMGSDAGGDWAPKLIQGNNFSIYMDTGDKAETERIFQALAEGGKITKTLAETFWGDYFGMCTDKFGINWMIANALPI